MSPGSLPSEAPQTASATEPIARTATDLTGVAETLAKRIDPIRV